LRPDGDQTPAEDRQLTALTLFASPTGNNFRGLEIHAIVEEQYVLASDRDFGLYILQPDL